MQYYRTKTDIKLILIKLNLEIWVHSHMASLPSFEWLWLEMMKGNLSMIKSYISDSPVPIEGRGLPADVDCLSGYS